MDLNEELDAFSKLTVLEDALERAAEILGPNAKFPKSNSHTIEHAFEIYGELSDLLDATRAGRMRLLERK
jgi:hypothetical protein